MRGFTDESAPYQTTFECLGVPLRVCASTEEMFARIEQTLPLDRTPSDQILIAHRLGIVVEDDMSYSIYNSATRVAEGGYDLELALVTLEGQIRSYISIHAPELVFVRGATVGYGGRAIVLVGESFSGVTTLVGALVRAGADFYSDEFAVLDLEGRALPYRASPPPGVGQDGSAGRGSMAPLPVALLVSTHFHAGADWEPQRLTGGAAALELMSGTVTVWTRPDESLKTVSRMLEGGAVLLKGERGEADEIAGMLLEQLAQLAPR